MPRNSALVVVSNRLPVTIAEVDGRLRVGSASGGLVTAMAPVLRQRGGHWIGWSGMNRPAEELSVELRKVGSDLGYTLDPVDLTEEEVVGFYEGFANEVLWPLFHDMVGNCNFDAAYWPIYEQANAKFARAVAEASSEEDYVWVHDYQLMLIASQLAAMKVKRRLGFFLHIPFPPLDVFTRLPWRQEILEGLLHFDLLGFQTERDLRNFIQCLTHRVETAEVEGDDRRVRIKAAGRVLQAGAFPISIDYADFLKRSVEDPVSELVARIRMKLPSRKLILGLDRLDYTKGIPNRLEAFDLALKNNPELRGRVTLLQVVVPSRSRVGEYQTLKDEVDRLVGRVNGENAAAGWTPIQYIFRRLSRPELLAFYRACDIALITPLKDGMNLVCKEYCACSLEDNGVLILSEFAGAAQELGKGALLVNPYHTEEVAAAIYEAVQMSEEERHRRMLGLRTQIRQHNVFYWVEDFLTAASESPDGLVSTGAQTSN